MYQLPDPVNSGDLKDPSDCPGVLSSKRVSIQQVFELS